MSNKTQKFNGRFMDLAKKFDIGELQDIKFFIDDPAERAEPNKIISEIQEALTTLEKKETTEIMHAKFSRS